MPETTEERSERMRRAAYIRWAAHDAAQRSADARIAAHKRYEKYPNPVAARKAEMAERRWQAAKKRRQEKTP